MTRWWVRAILSVTVLAILLQFVPLARVLAAIRAVDPWVWVASVFVFAGGQVLNAVKLRLLCGLPAPTLSTCLRAHFAGISANLGFPGVAGGDVVRAAHLVPTAGAPRIAVAAIADRLVDFVVLLGVAGSAAVVAGLPMTVGDQDDRGVNVWVIGLAVLIVLAAALGLRRARRTRAWPRLREAWGGLVARPGALGLALFIGLGVQLTFLFTILRLAAEVGVSMPLAPWIVAWAGAKLSAVLPISLGGIGVREATLVTILAGYGAPSGAVLATGLLWEGALVAGSLGGLVVTQLLRR